MDFIDEKDDFAVALGHFVDDSFQTFLEFALILGSGNQSTHIKRENLLGAEVFRHVATHDALCKPFGDGCLASTRLTNQHRVVFSAAAENLQHAPYFVVTPDYGVKFARTGTLIEVYSIFVKRIICFLGTLIGSFLPLTQLIDSALQFFFIQPCILEDGRCGRIYLEQGHQHCLEGYIFVALLLGYVKRLLQNIV